MVLIKISKFYYYFTIYYIKINDGLSHIFSYYSFNLDILISTIQLGVR